MNTNTQENNPEANNSEESAAESTVENAAEAQPEAAVVEETTDSAAEKVEEASEEAAQATDAAPAEPAEDELVQAPPAVPAAPKSSRARWYVLHVYSGFEDKVAEAIKEKARKKGLADHVEEIMVPTEEVVEVKRGQRVNSERKFFPGYVLARLDLNDDVWHLIKDTPKVTGFLGGGNKPAPISEKEAVSLMQQIQEGVERPRPSVVYDIGEEVRVIDGPFASFNGVVEDLDEDKAKLKVSVSIFGRATPVELEYSQVEKM